MTGRPNTQELAARLGIAGASLGALEGTVQAVVGERIPDWTGAKDERGTEEDSVAPSHGALR